MYRLEIELTGIFSNSAMEAELIADGWELFRGLWFRKEVEIWDHEQERFLINRFKTFKNNENARGNLDGNGWEITAEEV